MFGLFRNFYRKCFPNAYLLRQVNRALVKNKESYLHKTGWLNSLIENVPVEEYGNPLPWMNYPMISLLKERLRKEHHVFEYGSGYSTHFFAKRANEVTSVEYDEVWYNNVKVQLPDNAQVLFRTKDYDGGYCRAILETNKMYDLVIVDGRDRVNCAKIALGRLKQEGVLILDDSQREQYLPAHDYFMEKGFKFLHLEGLKPSGKNNDRATLYYRSFNCFNI